MAVGKNKRLAKSGKKGNRKKIVDPFSRKDWYRFKAPAMFTNRNIGFTCVNRTVGTKIASDNLKGRVVEVSLSDLQNDQDPERSFRKFKLIVEDVQGTDALTNFHGMKFSTDKLCHLVRKWQDVIEGIAEVKTKDGYLLRMFCIGFTKREVQSVKKTCYAKKTLVKAVRAKMVQNMRKSVVDCTLRQLINKLIPDSIASDIEKDCRRIFPLTDVFVYKVKVLKKPRFILSNLLEMHEPSKEDIGRSSKGDKLGADIGVPVDRPDDYEPPVLDDV